MSYIRWPLLLSFLVLPLSTAAATLQVYGPGGPYPAMRDAAAEFSKKHDVKVEVTAGPTPQWIDKAKADADLIYSGSENMMTDFVKAMEGRIVETSITPMYLRPSAILVRPGNPTKIKDLPDLTQTGHKVMVVQGAGQTGMWEDMIGRQGDINMVRQLRKNIVFFAPNSAEAKKMWIEDPSIDAWIIYNIWQVANPKLADTVAVSKPFVIYRDSGIALTKEGESNPLAKAFKEFLLSPEGASIFARWGWMTPKQSQ